MLNITLFLNIALPRFIPTPGLIVEAMIEKQKKKTQTPNLTVQS